MEHKSLKAIELKLLEDEKYPNGVIEGYAATWDVDSVNERIERGAFHKYLGKFLSEGFVAFNHDWQSLPIAMPVDAHEDDKGLFVRAAFHSTPEAQNVRRVAMERMAQGLTVKNSIGYEVHADGKEQDIRILKDVELFEWSPVNVPANRGAGVLAVKSGAGAAPGLNEHIEEVVSALDVLAGRVRERHDFRTKEGRVLSGSNRQRISVLLERLAEVEKDLNDLLTDTEPANGKWADTHKLRAETLIIQQRLKALGV